jgi:uncharacterized protein YhaN
MRIARVDLLAYGPFRGLELDLAAPGLHVVLGKNEAGKSTTLRAITGLLYGIDRRTRDAHLHKPNELRIGGVLVAEPGGERLRIVRRKGDTNTLLDDDGKAIDEAILLRLLSGVTRETFESAFGLDHVKLREGAEALLDGHGALGESLFDASVGGGGEVQRLKRQLEQEADAIYRPRGSALPLNEALKAFTEAQRAIREKQSLPDAYITQQRALEEADAERVAKAARRAELVAKRAVLERARRRVPLERKRARLAESRAELASIAEHGPRVDAIASGLAEYERALRDLRESAVDVSRLRERAAEAAARAGLDPGADRGGVRLDGRKEGRIQKLVAERTKYEEKVAAARAEIMRAERELARAGEAGSSDEVEAAPALARAVERARALGDIEARHASKAARASRRREDLARKAAAAGFVDAPLDELVALRLPSLAAVERLASRATDVEKAIAKIEGRLSDVTNEMLSLERQIGEHSGDFAPPSAADLRQARARRSDAWHALRAADASRRVDHESAFERAMHEADELADRMIREADRVTMLARLRASAETVAKQRARIEEEIAKARADRAAIDAELAALFAPASIAPASFGEMRAFLELHARVVEEHARLRDDEAEVEEARATIAGARRDLAQALGLTADGPETLVALVDLAAQRLDVVEGRRRAAAEAAKTRAKLVAEIDQRTAALEADVTSLAAARAALGELLVPLGLPEDASSEEVQRTLEAVHELFEVEGKRADAEARRAAAERDVRAFEEAVARAVADLAPDLRDAPTAEAAATLVLRTRKAQEIAAEAKSVEEQLADIGDDAIPPELEAVAADPDCALAALEEIDGELAELDRERSQLDQRIGGIRVALEGWRSESGAADASAQAQEALARIRANVERWCRAKLAATILAREIERYRQENQGPLLSSASQLFARLTRSAFEGVRAGYTEKDEPALRCVRANGAELDVDSLSEGTRDQLYLALRLASLLRHAQIAGPMPLVLDDVLIHFDDERSRAALEVLAEVACKMQVIFFTHHARDVELARAAVPAAQLHVHELVSAAPAQPTLVQF